MNELPSGEVKWLIPEVGYHATPRQTLQSILAAHGLHYDRLEDIPPKVAREIQRRPVFEDFRSIELPAPTILASLGQPLLRDLLVTRIGYCTHAAGHFIPRPEGSLDHVLTYCVAGQGWCEIGGRRWLIPEDTVLLVPAGAPHCYGAAADDPWSMYWIHFTGRAAGDYARLLGATAENPLFRLVRSQEILSVFEMTYRLMHNVHAHMQLVAASGALAHFLGMANIARHSVNNRSHTAEVNVRKTVLFMREHLGGRYSLRQFAQMAHMSAHHYCSLFKTRHGFSPIEYFNRLKIQHARELLTGSGMQIRQIARDLGFDDPYYFSRLFRRIVGVSPAQYRKSPADR
ncbi:MAG: helix-turn-helix domain-containing protein [Pirellulales bacterium]|nr:helix-turn-helix domain-containing protein [Pirellulales bacterium]